MTLYALAQAGERIRPVVSDTIRQRTELILSVTARRELLFKAFGVRRVGARDTRGIVGGFGY